MNQASNQDMLGFLVYRTNGEWLVYFNGEHRLFVDGMVLNAGIPAEV